MTTPILQTPGFAAAVIDALSSHICVIDGDGVIVAVNRAWRKFAAGNPPVSPRTTLGANYLTVCEDASGPGSEGAAAFASGVRAVLRGERDHFQMEYPCHAPTENRWFLGDVTRLGGRRKGAVISHATITNRKLLEFKLMRLAETDGLTGLPNRRYFIAAANLEVERVRRFGAQASLVMLDLDHFKTVNDTHGHSGGDQALGHLARVCRKRLRQIDLLARIGGEEFALLLPGTSEAGALAVAEVLRRALSETPVKAGGGDFSMSASFGVAEISPGDTSVAGPLDRADRALYAAKRAGRNRVMSFATIPAEARRPAA